MMEPEEFDESEELGACMGPVPRGWHLVPDFTDTPYWVRTFYWTPLIGGLAKHWMRARGRYRPTPPAKPGDGWHDDGVREPRRPRPFAGAGAVALEVPFDDEDSEWLDENYALAGLDEPGAPTTAA